MAGDQAFQLHDTYGFPIDLTLEMAAEQGLAVDEGEFRRLMAEQRQRAKADAAGQEDRQRRHLRVRRGAGASPARSPSPGTTRWPARRRSSGLLVGRRPGCRRPARAPRSRWCWTAPRSTPRAAASWPTPAPSGVGATARLVEVLDVQPPVPGLIVHRGAVPAGEIAVGAPVHAEIDVERRRAISRSHTATHLVHRAFRGALGESAAQAGSENSPGPVPVRLHRRAARCRRRCCATSRTRSTRC